MNYVTKMRFEYCADFGMLKRLVLDAATENGIDIFDNVYDWSLRLSAPPDLKLKAQLPQLRYWVSSTSLYSHVV